MNNLDNSTTVGVLRYLVADFVSQREWGQFHTPKNLSTSIAIEAAELMERFQWMTAEESKEVFADPDECSAIADELADVIIYCLSLSNRLAIDVSTAVMSKIRANKDRYPVEEFKGRYK